MPQSKKDNLLRDGNEDLVSIVIPVYNSEKFPIVLGMEPSKLLFDKSSKINFD